MTEITEITFQDKQYKIADLSDKAKTCWNHLVDLEKQLHQLRFKTDQVEASKETITRHMEGEIKNG
ncbi:MAG: hypothetical protein CMD09_03180 [Flavobacteriales bacterium]|nr:hypothetical protein [Flavobacteriales bacterium]|tara:strand:- start:870 stop:1067 length:198 start_codon:yes stop_codon:yes gene_type:complete